MSYSLPPLAPQFLTQPIKARMRLMSGNRIQMFNWYGGTSRPDMEEEIVKVASYGRQLGRMSEVMEILMNRLDPAILSREETEAVTLMRAMMLEIRAVKTAMQ